MFLSTRGSLLFKKERSRLMSSLRHRESFFESLNSVIPLRRSRFGHRILVTEEPFFLDSFLYWNGHIPLYSYQILGFFRIISALADLRSFQRCLRNRYLLAVSIIHFELVNLNYRFDDCTDPHVSDSSGHVRPYSSARGEHVERVTVPRAAARTDEAIFDRVLPVPVAWFVAKRD